MITVRIINRQLKFVGDIMRKDNFENFSLTGQSEWNINREKQRVT